MKPALLALAAVALAYAADDASRVRKFLNHSSQAKQRVHFADGCALTDLQPGVATSASLESADCPLSSYFPGAPGSLRTDLYQITAASNLVISFEMKAGSFEPDLYILNDSGDLLSYDQTEVDDKRAVAAVHVRSGRYYVLATAFSGNGDYTIRVDAETPRVCKRLPLTVGTDLDAAFDNEDCRLIDLTVGETYALPLRTFSIEASERKVLNLGYSSTAAPALLVLSDENLETVATVGDGKPELEAIASVLPGTYTAYLMSIDGRGGAFKLRSSWQDTRSCPAEPLAGGATVSGSLAASDCRYLDIFAPASDVSPTDQWSFNVSERSVVKLNLASREFLPYVAVTGPNNKEIAWSFNTSETGNETLMVSLDPGAYKAIASTVGGVGNYTLALAAEAPKVCEAPPLAAGKTTGTITAADCRVLDRLVPSFDARRADAYQLRVTERAVYGFDVFSPDFTVSFVLYDASGVPVYGKDTFEGLTRAQILLNEGEYSLHVVSSDVAGRYELIMETAPPRACDAAGSVGPDSQFDGALEEDDCSVGDTIPGTISPNRIDWVTLTVPEPRTITIRLETPEFPPAILLMDEKQTYLGGSLNPLSSARVELVRQLPAGTYRIGVTNGLGLGGRYTLTTSSTAPAAADAVAKQ